MIFINRKLGINLPQPLGRGIKINKKMMGFSPTICIEEKFKELPRKTPIKISNYVFAKRFKAN